MAGKIYNGIILNGTKYEAVEVLNDDIACEHCGLLELCDSLDFSPCEMFEGMVRFRIRR